MDQTFIQKRIEQKAEERLEKEYEDFLRTLMNNPFVSGMKINFAVLEESSFVSKTISLFSSNEHSSAIFTYGIKNIKDREGVNLKELIDSRREQLIKEETDLLLEELDSVKHFFEEN